jgi:heme/copper-type cytochrome/quinol oxidase subunit 4
MSTGAIITLIVVWAIFIAGFYWCFNNLKKFRSKWE